MYALCVSGAVNKQGFVWKFCMRYISIFIHSDLLPDFLRLPLGTQTFKSPYVSYIMR